MQEAKYTPGDWKTSYFDALENDGTGTLVDAGYKKRVIKAVRFDEQGRRCTQFLAEVHEQAAHPEEGAANAALIVAAPQMAEELGSIHVGTTITTEHFNRIQRLLDKAVRGITE